MNAPSVLCGAAEIALNRYLRLEPAVLAECAQLSGRWMQVTLNPPDLSLALEFMADGVRVVPDPPAAADVKISGTPLAFAGALRQLGGKTGGAPAGLTIEGKAELLDRFRGMLLRVGFDPEEWLAPLLGGVTAHRAVEGLKRLFDWSRGSTRRLADHGAEYLREESYDLARGRDVEAWMADVDDARDALERLEARVRRLEGPGRMTGETS